MILVVVASIVEVPLIWELADTFNFFIVIPNVVALVYLNKKVLVERNRMAQDVTIQQ